MRDTKLLYSHTYIKKDKLVYEFIIVYFTKLLLHTMEKQTN